MAQRPIRIPSYLHVSKSTMIAIGVMTLLIGLVSIWAYHYTRLSHPSYVCGMLGLGHLRYEKEVELVTEELNGKLVNGYRYNLHFQGISSVGYRILVNECPEWRRLGPGNDRYYASHVQGAGGSSGDFYAQTDIRYCTLTYTSYIEKLLPVNILWLIAFVTGTIFVVSLMVVLLSLSVKAARGTVWPQNNATWRAAMFVSGVSFLLVAIALIEV